MSWQSHQSPSRTQPTTPPYYHHPLFLLHFFLLLFSLPSCSIHLLHTRELSPITTYPPLAHTRCLPPLPTLTLPCAERPPSNKIKRARYPGQWPPLPLPFSARSFRHHHFHPVARYIPIKGACQMAFPAQPSIHRALTGGE